MIEQLSIPSANTHLRDDIRQVIRIAFKPLNTGSLSEWADKNRYVGTGAFVGAFETSRVPYFREVMDCMGDAKTERIVLLAAAQSGKTTIIENAIGFYMSQQPSSIMLVCADGASVKSFSEQKLSPMIEQSPTLAKLVKKHRVRDSGNRVSEKKFPGGYIAMVSAKSAHSLRGRSIRILLMDEVDAYDSTLKKEGSPISLAEERTTTFPNRKIVMTSTPTVAGFSAIERAFLHGTQEFYHVPCPQCSYMQRLEWGGLDKSYGIKWDKGNDPSTVYYLCKSGNGCIFHEADVFQMVQRGEWIAENPNAPARTRSFHLNALYSPFAGNDWHLLVKKWFDAVNANNRDAYREFINLKLAETFDDEATRMSSTMLQSHIRQYDAPCPAGIGHISCGVDIQDSRIEAYIYGWGDRDKAWLIDREIIQHDPNFDVAWLALDEVLARTYLTRNGVPVAIRAVAIDSGHKPELVYRYVRSTQAKWDAQRLPRKIIATKGASNDPPHILDKLTFQKNANVMLQMIGTGASKDFLFTWLQNSKDDQQYLYLPDIFPEQYGAQRLLDRETLEQMTSEKSVKKSMTTGRVKREWLKIRPRNEAWDCFVLAYCAFLSLGPSATGAVASMAEKLTAMQAPSGSFTPIVQQRPANQNQFGIKIWSNNRGSKLF